MKINKIELLNYSYNEEDKPTEKDIQELINKAKDNDCIIRLEVSFPIIIDDSEGTFNPIVSINKDSDVNDILGYIDNFKKECDKMSTKYQL